MPTPSDPLPLDPHLTADTAFLRRLARGLVLDGAGADDLVQEAWVTALRRSRAPAHERGWLARVLRFKASEQRRAEGRRRLHEEAGARAEATQSTVDSAARLEVLERVVTALRTLQEPYRTAVTLRYLDELPPREIAGRTGVPVNTARSRVQRGLVQLRSLLDGEHGEGRDGLLVVLGPIAMPGRSALVAGGAGASWIGGIVMNKTAILGLVAAAGLVALSIWGPWAFAPDAEVGDADVARGVTSSAEPSAAVGSADSPVVAPPRPAEEPARVPATIDPARPSSWVVRGRVQKAGGGALAGIPVHLEQLHGTNEVGTRLAATVIHTDAKGRFEWPLESPEVLTTVEVLATAPDWYGWTHDQRCLPGDDAPTFEIELYPVDGVLSGTVRDERGRAIEGARLHTSTDDTVSDAEGGFRLATATAWSQHRIRVSAPSYATATVVVDRSESAQATRVDVTLHPERVLTGTVVDEERLPVEGASVRVFGLEQDARSDSSGRFRIEGVSRADESPGLVCQKAGYLLTSMQAEGDDVEIVLRRGVPLAGVVVDEDGHPLAGAELYVGTGSHSIEAVHSWTDVDGSFRFDAVPGGRGWLNTSMQGFPVDRRRISPAADGASAEPLVIVLGRGRSLTGQVVDEHGRALAGVGVYPQVRHERHGDAATTDAEGRFELANLAAKETSLDLIAAGFVRRTFELDGDSWNGVVIELERAGGLAGLVFDAATGEPVEAFRIRFVAPRLQDGDRRIASYRSEWGDHGFLFSGNEGRWQTELDAYAIGAVTGIEVIAEGYAAALVDRVVVQSEPVHDDFRTNLERGVTLTGIVSDASTAAPIEGARVYRRAVDEVRRGHDNEYTAGRSWTRTDREGRFAFAAAPSGQQVLEVDAPGYSAHVDGPFEVQPGATNASRSIALSRGATLFGRALDATGRPLDGAQLVLADLTPDYASGRQHEWRATTDAEGRYRIVGLPDGGYELSRRASDEASERSYTELAQRVVIAGVDHELDLVPGGTGRVLGTAALPDGEALVLAISLLWQPEKEGDEIPLDRPRLYGALIVDGRFEFRGLPAGSYTILCGDRPPGDDGYFLGSHNVVVTRGQSVEAALEISRVDWSEMVR